MRQTDLTRTETKTEEFQSWDDVTFPVPRGSDDQCCEVTHHGRFYETSHHRRPSRKQVNTVVVTVTVTLPHVRTTNVVPRSSTTLRSETHHSHPDPHVPGTSVVTTTIVSSSRDHPCPAIHGRHVQTRPSSPVRHELRSPDDKRHGSKGCRRGHVFTL